MRNIKVHAKEDVETQELDEKKKTSSYYIQHTRINPRVYNSTFRSMILNVMIWEMGFGNE